MNVLLIGSGGREHALAWKIAGSERVSEVLVLDLAKGIRFTFNNIGEQAWSDVRPLLALTVAVDGGVGNGV